LTLSELAADVPLLFGFRPVAAHHNNGVGEPIEINRKLHALSVGAIGIHFAPCVVALGAVKVAL
jgi:hypothetical protein